MEKRKIKDRIFWMGAIDWERRLFDSLVPLPDGTSYNAYLIEGSEKTALLDSVDPAMAGILMAQLQGTTKVDFIICNHAEQDHSGSIPFVSMHGSTQAMVDYLTAALVVRSIRVELFNLTVTDIGKLAMALVDAGTIIVGTPTVLTGPHPLAAYAAFLANALRPKAQYLSIVGSYGWDGKTVETLAGMIPNLKVEVLEPVFCKGMPDQAAFTALHRLAEAIAQKHRESGFQ